MTMPNPYAPPESRVADVTPLEELPSLWNPKAAASWSLLLSPIFGALVQMKNWEVLGESEQAAKSKNWAIGSLVFYVFMSLVAVFTPDSKGFDSLTRAMGLALFFTWYYKNGKSQQVYVLAKFGPQYKKKGWSKPLLLAMSGFLGFLIAMGLVGFAMAALH